jgi:hypothetical protein
MTTLNDFVSSITSAGLMTSNRFDVEFALPPALLSSNSGFNYKGDLKKVLMHCDSVVLPGMTISTQQARTYGELREMPYERLFDNINLTFYVDTTMDSKALFDSWINSIQDPVTRQFNYYKEYITDITIFTLDKDNEDTYRVKLFECYPKSISPIQLDYSSKDVMKLQVSMNYRYWISGSAGSTSEDQSSVDIDETLTADAGLQEFDPYGFQNTADGDDAALEF